MHCKAPVSPSLASRQIPIATKAFSEIGYSSTYLVIHIKISSQPAVTRRPNKMLTGSPSMVVHETTMKQPIGRSPSIVSLASTVHEP